MKKISIQVELTETQYGLLVQHARTGLYGDDVEGVIHTLIRDQFIRNATVDREGWQRIRQAVVEARDAAGL